MQKITQNDIKITTEQINEQIKPFKIDVNKRYGYNGIDLYNCNNELIKTLKTGLKRKDAYLYLQAFLIGLEFEKPNRPTIESITIKRKVDDDPDLSYLDLKEDSNEWGKNWDHVSTEEKNKVIAQYGSLYNADKAYYEQDKKRLKAYGGSWYMLGIVAHAVIKIPIQRQPNNFKLQDINSGGLWGIESDSEESYFKEIEQEQIKELLSYLEALNVDIRGYQNKIKVS